MSGGMKSNAPSSGNVRSDVLVDWRWADGHMRTIVNVLLECAAHVVKIETASKNDDLRKATDFNVTTNIGQVAVRIRRPGYLERFGDFTLRAWRKGGAKTELHKIRDGYCDWYLYAWSDGEGGFEDWIFIDLNTLRESGLLDNRKFIGNKGGRTAFVSIPRPQLILTNSLVARKRD